MSELHVVFGTGPLGRFTAEWLLKMGKKVRLVNRSGKMEQPPAGAELTAADVSNPTNATAVSAGAAAVYQCAQPPYHQWAQKFPALQASILQAAQTNNAKLIVGDNLYMYGSFSGRLREDSPQNPHTKKGKVRAQMAQEILEAHAAGKIRAAMGRGSDFFGPYDGALTSYAILPALQGKAVNLLGDPHQPHTFTYVKDFGRLLAELGTREEALGQVWFVPSPLPVTQREFVALLETALGKPVRFQAAGAGLMRFLGIFNPAMAETVEMMYEWTAPFVLDTSKAERAFGWQATPLGQAIRETLAHCR